METSSPTGRATEAAVDPRFPGRWSPRAFVDRPVAADDLASLFEAARWAPSCFNEQPWLFVYGATGQDGGPSAARDAVEALLMEGNRAWANQAPVLGVVFARKGFERDGSPNRWAAYDSGAAAMAMALQAQELGLSMHFMGGFDADAAGAALGVDPEAYEAMAAFAIGTRGDPASLPEGLREREQPSPRKPLAEVARLASPAAGDSGGAA